MRGYTGLFIGFNTSSQQAFQNLNGFSTLVNSPPVTRAPMNSVTELHKSEVGLYHSSSDLALWQQQNLDTSGMQAITRPDMDIETSRASKSSTAAKNESQQFLTSVFQVAAQLQETGALVARLNGISSVIIH